MTSTTATNAVYSLVMATLNATSHPEPEGRPEGEPEAEPEPSPELIFGTVEPEPYWELSAEPEGSSGPESEPEPGMGICVQVTLALIAALVMVVGSVGNTLVIAVIMRMKTGRTVTDLFLVSLAVADLFVCVICTPLIIVGITVHQGHTGVSYSVEQVMFYFSSVASILSLTAIALDRHDAVIHPMSRRLTVQRSKRAILIIWAISTTAALVIYFIPSNYEFGVLAVFFVGPFAFMVACYYRILVVSRKAAARAKQGKLDSRNSKSTGQSDKTLRMVIVVLVVFVVSWVPSLISRLLKYQIPMTAGQLAAMEVSACLVAYAGSALNFVVYAFMSRKFQRGLITLMGCQSYMNRKVDTEDSKNKSDIGRTCINLAVNEPPMSRRTADDSMQKISANTIHLRSHYSDLSGKHLL